MITTFNRANLLCHAIDSAVNQDFPREQMEIIVVDDGSTDETKSVVERRYGSKVKYLYKSNGGINSAFQYGFDAANGEIIAQLDSDDFWYPQKLSKCIPLFDQAPDVVAVFHDLDIFTMGVEQSIGSRWKSLNVSLTDRPCDALQPYLDGQPIPAWTTGSLWRRSALAQILPFPPELWGFCDAYCARNIVFFGRVCALTQSLGGSLNHETNDYGGGTTQFDRVRIERDIRENEVMSDTFSKRCRQFGVVPSRRRLMIQKLASADSHMALKLLDGKLAATRWLFNNVLELPNLAVLQLLINLLFPSRLAVFVKNRIIGRLIALD